MDYILLVLYVMFILPPWWALIFLIPFYICLPLWIQGKVIMNREAKEREIIR